MKLRGPLGSFSPGIGPPKHDIYILFIMFIFKCEFGALPKNSGLSVKLRDPSGSFSSGIGPPKHNIFVLFLFLNLYLGPLPKNSGPNPMSFQFLTGGRLT